ncbi:radical SAM family heme chaperone HemW [Phenylobacterium sp.]|uniref:radical SAM family heme chaperone HemW n=1 Tax=Phenylobacterium sp. TaxID=1871053 RepID=UPI0027316583|nr:radical SAM family heme chaperone HemW [Phenylobacterium sp.]MDP1616515.1 radical SAM family heme chaperone HemW [Phenylobacterium sp.]MDP1986314.1 radical SAM family heme chaperone HemW [Phenylobacterium sp.]
MTEPGPQPPPLGVYVHWPYCARICPYCDFNVYRDRGRSAEQAALVAAIVQDLATQAALTGPRTLVSVFFGGGTPSLMDPDAVALILETARRLWTPAGDLEVSLEANPTDAETQRFAALAQAGVGRLSLGVQALNDDALRFLGRDHDAATARRALAVAAQAFGRVSLDLIYARPGQTPAAWTAELEEALAYGVEHVSPYQLTIEAGTAFDRAVRRGQLVPPDDEAAATLFETTQAVLAEAGFEAYEVSNHARGEAARSRHNLVYWRGWDYVGVGPGAHGRITLGGHRHATEAQARPAAYIGAVGESGRGFPVLEPLSAEAAAEERALSGLRIKAGVAYSELVALGLSPDHNRVKTLVAEGLLAEDNYKLRATPAGRLVLDHVTRRLLV